MNHPDTPAVTGTALPSGFDPNDSACPDPASVEWIVHNALTEWSGKDCDSVTLDGGAYRAEITAWDNTAAVDYRWAVFGDDGEFRAKGTGTADTVGIAKTAVEIVLSVQRDLGNLASDVTPPTGSITNASSALPPTEVAAAVAAMRARISHGRALNPITGRPDPFSRTPAAPPPPATVLFDRAEAVRAHWETTLHADEARRDRGTDGVRWDTAKLTPGGAFIVIDDVHAATQVRHTRSGTRFHLHTRGGKLGRRDLLRWATVLETIPDRAGDLPDWSPSDPDQLRDTMSHRSYLRDGDGVDGAIRAAVEVLMRQKIRSGALTHPLIVHDQVHRDAVTNRARAVLIDNLKHALERELKNAPHGADRFDRTSMNIVRAADTIAAIGAPDISVALLRRRANEIRELYGDNAPEHGSSLVDEIAGALLAAYSPVRSPGDRVLAVQPGERVSFLDSRDPELMHQYRVLTPLIDTAHTPRATAAAIDERTGQHVVLGVDAATVMVLNNPGDMWSEAVIRTRRCANTFLVTGPGEPRPRTAQDLRTRADDDRRVIPADVLAAADALLAAVHQGSAPSTTQQPPKHDLITWTPAQPVRNEEQLAAAQQRITDTWVGVPVTLATAPVTPGFTSLAEARAHLSTITEAANHPHGKNGASSAAAVVELIDSGNATLSAAGTFVVAKHGRVLHAHTGLSAWPPAYKKDNLLLSDLFHGGYKLTGRAAAAVADVLEHGVFAGEQINWCGDGRTAAEQLDAIAARTQCGGVLRAAHRYAYLRLVHGSAKPTATDRAMLHGMIWASMPVLDAPNPEAILGKHSALAARDYAALRDGRHLSTHAAATKAGANLAAKVALECDIADITALLQPLNAVRRLIQVAAELDGKTIATVPLSTVSKTSSAPTLAPATDLRAMAEAIIDTYDENKLSPSARFRRAGLVGVVKPTTSMQISVGATGLNRNGDKAAAEHLANLIHQAGGLTFARDTKDRLTVLFAGTVVVDALSDPDIDLLTGRIALLADGTITIHYCERELDRRKITIRIASGEWELSPAD